MENIISILNQNLTYIVVGILIIMILLLISILVLIGKVKKVEKKYKKMMRGTSKESLEELITSKLNEIDEALQISNSAVNECQVMKEEIKGCVSKISIMRYNAFENVGSDLSFSIAILDSHNDGILLTGIYSRQDSTTYAKPIKKGESTYNLSEEEKYVLNEAINKE